ncbi:hypothetical protein TRFO_34848 [Tritrichomonas foetus]|uniref:USP domain-containing protein n=1 Tax=Tritrichomonas foetus TaxID=1144522 RepID=A0A1J4JN56_9EUKA|nr:hypothetical protein TRFO_34848 [Tritrichomonas foetus]|eukprot:OHS98692.1 hypothetical protein TRFO_34848 [Tritrichomonas foetus]
MAIIEPETDINLWISIISQSLNAPDELNNSLPSIERVFDEIIENPEILPNKFQISEEKFYRLIYNDVLFNLMAMKSIPQSNISIDVFSTLLSYFVNLSRLFFYKNDENLTNIISILFYQKSILYKANYQLFENVVEHFLNYGLFAEVVILLEELENTEQMNNKTLFLSEKFPKLPLLLHAALSCVTFLIEYQYFDWVDFCCKCLNPLLKYFNYSSEQIAFPVINDVLNVFLMYQKVPPEPFDLIFKIIETYLETDVFSLVLCALKISDLLIRQKFFVNHFISSIYNGNSNQKNVEFIKRYLKINIHEEFCGYLGIIYSCFFNYDIICLNDLKNLWSLHNTIHVTLLAPLFSIFIEISKSIHPKNIDGFIEIIFNTENKTETWLKSIIEIGGIFQSRNISVLPFIDLLNSITAENSTNNKNDGDMVLKHIAENALPKFKSVSFTPDSFMHFTHELTNKIHQNIETENDMKVLESTLPKYTILKNKRTQLFFETIISVFNKYNYLLMKKIVEKMISNNYQCEISEKVIDYLLNFADENDKIYDFLTNLFSRNYVTADILLKNATKKLQTNFKFYKLLKSIILNMNNGLIKVKKYPFQYEDILWHFCIMKSDQRNRFQHFLARIYSRNEISDQEMIHAFYTKWIQMYNLGIEKGEHKNGCDFLYALLNIMKNFVHKIEFYNFVPINYHFCDIKQNISIFLIDNKFKFTFDNRRSISSLIQYIKTLHSIYQNKSFSLKFGNKILNETNVIMNAISQQEVDDNKVISLSTIPKTDIIGVKKVEVRNRACYPSIYLSKMENFGEKLLNFNTESDLFYLLPTFQSTIHQIGVLTTENFTNFFPYDNPIKFLYNFESFLEFHILDQKIGNNDFHEYVKNIGLIDYLINCGLSTANTSLMCKILQFLHEFYNIEENIKIDHDILNEQILMLIESFIPKPGNQSKILENVFYLQFESFHIPENLFEKLIMHESNQIKSKAQNFFSFFKIPLGFYVSIFDRSKYYPNSFFYSSLKDHILLKEHRNDDIVRVVLSTFYNMKPLNVEHILCLKALIEKLILTKEELDKAFNYLINKYLVEQINCRPFYAYDESIQTISLIVTNFAKDSSAKESILLKDFFAKLSSIIKLVNFSPSEYVDGKEIDFRKSKIGLENLGATCYINSVLQQLFNIKEFRNELYSINHQNNHVVYELKHLFSEMDFSYNKICNPTKFIESLDIDINVQFDCCEFMINLLSRLKNSTFTGKLKHSIASLENENDCIESLEEFNVLPITIKNLKNMNESLNQMYSTDFLTGENGYRFNNNTKIDSKKNTVIYSLRNNFVIQLQRFEFNHSTHVRDKIKNRFEFDLKFTKCPMYELNGFIIHCGESAESGHYISYIRDGNHWIELNDTTVSYINQEKALEKAYNDGYLLFYRSTKADNNSPLKVDQFQDIITNNKIMMNKRMIVCQSFFDLMTNLLLNYSANSFQEFSMDILNLCIYYFFRVLWIYKRDDNIEKFGEILYDKCNQDETILFMILELWGGYSMEGPLLFSYSHIMRKITCKILKLVASKIECFDEIHSLLCLYQHFYHEIYNICELFELVCFTFNFYGEQIRKIAIDRHWLSSLIHLIKEIQRRIDYVNFKRVNFHFFFELALKIGINRDFETALIDNNLKLIISLLSSQTPIHDLSQVIKSLENKYDIISRLQNYPNKSQALVNLLSICKNI